MNIKNEVAERGHEYYMKNRVVYIELNHGKGRAFVNGTLAEIGDNILFPVSIALYGISAAVCLAIVVLAVKKKPRKFIYVPLLVLIGVFFELFGWHRRAFLSGMDAFGYWLTFSLAILLFAFAGALTAKGKKKRIISAVACSTVWAATYSLLIFLVGDFILDGFANALLIGVVYILTGIEALTILVVMLKKLVKEK